MATGCGKKGDDSSNNTPVAEVDNSSSGFQADTAPIKKSQANFSWDNITAASVEDSLSILYDITRHIDYWHQGKTPVVTLKHNCVDAVTDEQGNTFNVTPEQWKGILIWLGSHGREKTPFRTMQSSEFPDDGLGEVARNIYNLSIVNLNSCSLNGSENRIIKPTNRKVPSILILEHTYILHDA